MVKAGRDRVVARWKRVPERYWWWWLPCFTVLLFKHRRFTKTTPVKGVNKDLHSISVYATIGVVDIILQTPFYWMNTCLTLHP